MHRKGKHHYDIQQKHNSYSLDNISKKQRKPYSFLQGAFKSSGEAQYTQSKMSGTMYSRNHSNEGYSKKSRRSSEGGRVTC